MFLSGSVLISILIFFSWMQRDTIIDIFYEKHLGQLIDVITQSCPPEKASGQQPGKQCGAKPEILSNICELLCFCVLHHPYRIKYFSEIYTLFI